jgi:hypothetical protein
VQHRRGAQRVLALVVLRPGVSDHFGKVPVADAFELERRLPGRAGDVDRVGGKIEEHLAGKRVVTRMQWRHRAAMSPRSSPRARPVSAISITVRRSSSVGQWRAAI